MTPESLTVSAAAAPSGTITAGLVAAGLAALLVVPAFVLLYVLDQKTLLPEEMPLDRTKIVRSPSRALAVARRG